MGTCPRAVEYGAMAAGAGLESRWRLRFTFALASVVVAGDVCAGKALKNPEFADTPPVRRPVDLSHELVTFAVHYAHVELKRLSSTYRYARVTACHRAELAPSSFGGSNVFLDLELDMLKNQPSRHDVIVFFDRGDHDVLGMAIDEFPNVTFRELPDPEV